MPEPSGWQAPQGRGAHARSWRGRARGCTALLHNHRRQAASCPVRLVAPSVCAWRDTEARLWPFGLLVVCCPGGARAPTCA
eukprot:3645550-Prymnesium_polylepis.1